MRPAPYACISIYRQFVCEYNVSEMTLICSLMLYRSHFAMCRDKLRAKYGIQEEERNECRCDGKFKSGYTCTQYLAKTPDI
jgi:hypothetical protein